MAKAENTREMIGTDRPQDGSSIGEWLRDEGIKAKGEAKAIKRVLARQLAEAMQKEGISKAEMARRMHTSRTVLDRLLDPKNQSVTLETLQKAARAVGRDLRLELLSRWLQERPIETASHAVPMVLVEQHPATPRRARVQRLSGSVVFEVTADQIAALNQHQIVELLRRLTAAELADAGIPLRSASVPAQINIPDGGEDGRVDWLGGPNDTQYLPSRFCIIQAKVSDPGPTKLKAEVWKKSSGKKGKAPAPSDAFVELLTRSGSYIVAIGKPLVGQAIQRRIAAIRNGIEQAGSHPDRLAAIEIYDTNRLADWASIHPSVALWVNELQRSISLAGFQTYGGWGTTSDIANIAFAEDGQPRFRLRGAVERYRESVESSQENLTFEAVAAIVIDFMSKPQRALRIVGPSGYGKTRLAFELFSWEQTKAFRLEPSSVVFASYDDVADRLGALTLELAESGAATTLVVDDCPDAVHQDLVNKARREGSRLRLVTTDVETRTLRDKHNLVIELGPASDELIGQIARHAVDDIRSSDVEFVCGLAQGFPRMAILAAEAVEDGFDPLQTVEQLIERIVWRGRHPDEEAALTLAIASLFTRVGVENEVTDELDCLARFVNVPSERAYQHLSTFVSRGIVVRRGDYVVVQPLPLAARLGVQRLENMPDPWLSKLFSSITPTMQLSLLRRLRWLDTSKKVLAFTRQLLTAVESFEELKTKQGAERLDRLVHIDPDSAMATLDRLLGCVDKNALLAFTDGRRHVIWALEKLVFRRETFVSAATLLHRLGAAETEEWGNSASGIFKNLFQLYLSGTEAEPDMRLQVLDQGLESEDQDERALCIEALGRMLQRLHFTRSGGSEGIGSSAPLTDWAPALLGEMFDFHREALSRLRDIACSDDPLAATARQHVGAHTREMLSLPHLFDDVRHTIFDVCAAKGFCPEAIMGVNSWLYFDSDKASRKYATKVRAFYNEILPSDPVEQALLYTRGWQGDLHDPDRVYARDADRLHDYAEQQARQLADVIVADATLLAKAVDRMTIGELHGAWAFAHRLAQQSSDPVELMKMALNAVRTADTRVEYRFFSGLIAGTETVSHEVALQCLELVLPEPAFKDVLVPMIRALRLDADALLMVVDLLNRDAVRPESVSSLSFGKGLDHLPPPALEPLLTALISHSPKGDWGALQILCMYLHGRKELAPRIADWFKDILLEPQLFCVQQADAMQSYYFEEAAKLLHRHGHIDADFVSRLTEQILNLASLAEHRVQLELDDAARKVLRLLIGEYPGQVWDCVHSRLETDDPIVLYRLEHLLELDQHDAGEAGLLHELPHEIYLNWLSERPRERLPFILGWVPLTQESEDGDRHWHSDLESVVNAFVNEPKDLEVIAGRFYPSSWWGSLADQLEPYLPLLQAWWNHPKAAVRRWALETHSRLSSIIANERRQDANRQANYGF